MYLNEGPPTTSLIRPHEQIEKGNWNGLGLGRESSQEPLFDPWP